jgi:hypothetical protein
MEGGAAQGVHLVHTQVSTEPVSSTLGDHRDLSMPDIDVDFCERRFGGVR